MQRSTSKSVMKGVRLDQERYDKLAAFTKATGMSESEAMRHLIDQGLMLEGASLYSAPLAQFVSSIMQAELEKFRIELEQRNDNLEERLAKVDAKGTKAALASTVILIDAMQGLFPAMSQMKAEEIWTAYWRQAGKIQSGKSFKQVKAELGDGS